MSETERERRTERRGRRRAAATVAQRPWQRMRLTFPPTAAVSADQLEAVHEASLTILEEVGMDILLPEAREVYRAAGATVEGQRVQPRPRPRPGVGSRGPGTVHAPPAIRPGTWASAATRSPSAPSPALPNCSDLAGERRPGSQNDFRNFMRLIQTLNIVQIIGGYPVRARRSASQHPPWTACATS